MPGPVADRKLRTYSGGMKRRAGIAQAIWGDPRLLVVDEPAVDDGYVALMHQLG